MASLPNIQKFDHKQSITITSFCDIDKIEWAPCLEESNNPIQNGSFCDLPPSLYDFKASPYLSALPSSIKMKTMTRYHTKKGQLN